ncbi:prepilin-type N-terminal cleavage/methylation domain-containing protein, partial [Candidatus Gracilibacteria bacterium]
MIGSKKKAFTLVELLVVIVIIGILAAIGFMNYGGYAGSAKDTARVKDLKTISEALELTLSKGVDLPQPDPLGKDNLGQDSFISESYDGINFKTGLFGDQKRLEFKGDLASLPIDPNGTKYRYSVSDDGRYYVLTATMEDGKEYKYSNFMDSTGLLASNKPNPSGNNSNGGSNNGGQNGGNPGGSGNPLNPGGSQGGGGQQQGPDDTPPQFLVSDGTIINVSFGVSPSLSQIQATDNSGKVTVDYTPKTINSNKTGDNPVRYTATDPAGNSTSITVIYRVGRKFTTPYFVDSSGNRLSSGMKKELNKGQAPNHGDIKARDEIDGELQVTRRNDVNVNVPGTYVITYVATNNGGQESNLNVQYVVKGPSGGGAGGAGSSISITEGENLNYVELGNKIVITGFKPGKETENLIIPEMIKGKKVTDINANAFKQLNKIKTIIAPGIEKVGSNAFQGNVIQSIDMGSLKTVGNNAFSNNQLTSITLPNVTTIGEYAFQSNQL